MISDLPHIDYKKAKKKGYNQKDYDQCVAYNAELERRYMEGKKGEQIDLTKLIQSA